MLGIVASSATTSAYLSNVFRIKRITMWAPVPSVGTSVTIRLDWIPDTDEFTTPTKTWSDTSVSVDHPAFLDLKPPKGSLMDKWHSSNLASNSFQLSYPVDTTMDITFNFIMNDNQNALVGPVLGAGVAGTIYHKTAHGMVIGLGLNSI